MKTSVVARLAVAAAILLGAAAAFSVGVNAEELSTASKPWLTLKKLETRQELDALPARAQIGMACSKCKSIAITTKRQLTAKPGRGTVEGTMVVHQCPGCGGTMTIRGDKQTALTHSCSKCGDDSAFCCATSPSEQPTKGMKKK
ncbi:MAG: hypothetical protein HYY24_05890 [Verrucomicrobia bacterium]|nr:hypothetical protein [Verrucomicrobiota bacterium]